jgi:hypothetical protein
MRENVYFPEREEISLHHLYRSLDFLARHKERIEEELYWQLADLLNLNVDLIFYDTTSIYFEIDEEDEGEVCRGAYIYEWIGTYFYEGAVVR